jgi:hypothetical protein
VKITDVAVIRYRGSRQVEAGAEIQISDFIRSAFDLFAYEREADGALVLAAGLPQPWLEGEGVAIEGLRTAYGRLSFSLQRQGRRLILKISAGLQPPPGGLMFVWPGER